jgi:sugar lactone lactonase YvrE
LITSVSNKLEVVVDHRCLLGEGPVWDGERNVICWLDVLSGQVHEYSEIERKHSVLDVGQMVGCIAITSDGNFIAGLKNGLGFIDRASGLVTMIGNPEEQLPNNRFNDGKCDPAGRLWAGTMSIFEEGHAGNLYMIDKSESIKRKLDKVTISNGIAWSKDKETLYYIDTPTYQVVAFDYDIQTGDIKNKRVAIDISKEDGAPDGMTLDEEGMVWIAHWDGWQLTRWDPRSGNKLSRIPLPVAKVTSCTFGGENLIDLYITSAKVDINEEELKRQPLAGSLFVIRNCGYQGIAADEYRL